jgi:hypothetical protein
MNYKWNAFSDSIFFEQRTEQKEKGGGPHLFWEMTCAEKVTMLHVHNLFWEMKIDPSNMDVGEANPWSLHAGALARAPNLQELHGPS